MTFKEAYFLEMFGHLPVKRERKQRPHRDPVIFVQMPRNCGVTYLTELIYENSPGDFFFVNRSKCRMNTSAGTSKMYFLKKEK